MNEIYVYLDISEELLPTNPINLEDIIRENNSKAILKYESNPFENGRKERSKDIVPVILAASASVYAIVYAISRLVDTLTHKPHIIEYEELEELREKGKIVYNKEGNPIWKQTKKYTILEPKQLKERTEMDIQVGVKGVVFRIKTDKK